MTRRRSSTLTQPREMQRPDYIGSGPPRVNGEDLWALTCACVDGDLATVQALLAKDPKLANASYWYETPTHYAIREGHLEVVCALLAAGADPACTPFCWKSWPHLLEDVTTRGLTDMQRFLEKQLRKRFRYHSAFERLAEAIRSFDPARVEAVLDAEPHLIQHTDAYGNSAVHWAVLSYQPELFPLLLHRYASLDMPRADGALPIHKAITRDYAYRDQRVPTVRHRPAAEMVQALIDAGARQPFGVLAWRGDLAALQRWIAAEPAVATRLCENRVSPLAFAAMNGQLAAVELLLAAGADPSAPELLTSRGRALYEAARRNDVAMAERLLAAGADPNTEIDSSGNPYYIVQRLHPDTCAPLQELLRRYGARRPEWAYSLDELKAAYRAHSPPALGAMGLSYIVASCDSELAQLMLDHDPGLARSLHAWDFRSPSTHVQKSPAVIALFHAAGLDLNRPDWRGNTLLHHAIRYDSPDVALWLITHGADLAAEEIEHGLTPLGVAVKHEVTALIPPLLAAGASPRAPADRPWAQPLTLAADKPEIRNLLQSADA